MPKQISSPKGVVTIGIARPEDAAALLKLRLEALSLNPEAFAADVDLTAKAGEEGWRKIIAGYASDQSGAIVVASAGDELVAMNGIVRGHWPKTRHSCTLWGVYVKPAWRGLHIGEAIINGCIDWAAENEVKVVVLGVITSNEAAIRCYIKCGFTSFGIQPRVTFFNDVYFDDLMMVRLL